MFLLEMECLAPLNRYFQVKNAKIKNNTFINCDYIQLCAGSDKERSAPPINSVMENNIFYNEANKNTFTVYDDIKGIAFKNNIISEGTKPIATGFIPKKISLTEQSGLLIPTLKGIGAEIQSKLPTKETTGVSWYSKEDKVAKFKSGKVIAVAAAINSLFEAVKNSNPGDVFELEAGKEYLMTKTIAVNHPITVTSKGGKATLLFEKKSLFDINNQGSLELTNLIFNGKEAPDYSGNAVIRTSKYSMNRNYELRIDNCDFQDLDINHSYDVLKVFKNTMANKISVTNSTFKDVSGTIMSLDKEAGEKGIFNAEFVTFKNNSFTNIGNGILDLLRDGRDESTFKGIQAKLVVGGPIFKVQHNNFFNTEKTIVTGDQKYEVSKNTSVDLSVKNTIKGNDGKIIGVLK